MLKFLSGLLPSISKRSASSRTSQSDLSLIAEHAEEIQETVPDENEHIAKLQEQIEYLLEEVGQENRFRTELSEYVADLKAEAKFIRRARWVFGFVCMVAGIFLLVTPLALVFKQSPAFEKLTDYPKSALLMAFIPFTYVTRGPI
jgi:hypothetical protein